MELHIRTLKFKFLKTTSQISLFHSFPLLLHLSFAIHVCFIVNRSLRIFKEGKIHLFFKGENKISLWRLCASNNADFVEIQVSDMHNDQFHVKPDPMRVKKSVRRSLRCTEYRTLADIVTAKILKAVRKHLIEYCTNEKHKMLMVQDI